MFERHYLSLSGSMQTTLMRITEKAKDIGWRTLFLALFPASLQPIVAYCTVCNKARKSLWNETTFSLSFSPYTNQTVISSNASHGNEKVYKSGDEANRKCCCYP